MVRRIMVFADMSPRKAGGYTQKGAMAVRLERLALNPTFSLLG